MLGIVPIPQNQSRPQRPSMTQRSPLTPDDSSNDPTPRSQTPNARGFGGNGKRPIDSSHEHDGNQFQIPTQIDELPENESVWPSCQGTTTTVSAR